MPQISKRLGLPGVHLTRFHSASVVRSIYPYYRIMQYAGLASLPARGKPADETSDHSRYSVHQDETGKRNVLSVLEVDYLGLCPPWQHTLVFQLLLQGQFQREDIGPDQHRNQM